MELLPVQRNYKGGTYRSFPVRHKLVPRERKELLELVEEEEAPPPKTDTDTESELSESDTDLDTDPQPHNTSPSQRLPYLIQLQK